MTDREKRAHDALIDAWIEIDHAHRNSESPRVKTQLDRAESGIKRALNALGWPYIRVRSSHGPGSGARA